MKIQRIKTVLWTIFSVFSLGWLTPALVLYWGAPRKPEWAVAGWAYLFSLVAAGAYVLKKSSEIKTVYNHVLFFVGVCLGALLANQTLLWILP